MEILSLALSVWSANNGYCVEMRLGLPHDGSQKERCLRRGWREVWMLIQRQLVLWR